MLTQIAHSVWKRNEVQLLGSTDIYPATLKILFLSLDNLIVMCLSVCSVTHVRLLAILWTIAFYS